MANSEKVKNIFNSISDDYDRLNDVISFNQHNVWRNKTDNYMFFHEGQVVLDLCCGTGDWTIQMAKDNPDIDVIGLDFSENMLKVAETRTQTLDNVSLIQGDAMSLDFNHDTFDYVTIGFGLRNLPDYNKALDEMYRVLKPGGTLVIIETSLPEQPVIKAGFNFYFGKVMPKLGGLIAGKEEEYKWLHESTLDFPNKKNVQRMLIDTGFTLVRCIPHAFGTAATYLAIKPTEKDA